MIRLFQFLFRWGATSASPPVTPAARVLIVGFEGRVMWPLPEVRRLLVAFEYRTLDVR